MSEVQENVTKNDKYESFKGESSNRIHISFSEFSLFNECGHRHLIEKYLKLYKQPPSIHLYFGDAMHSAIEHTIKDKLTIDERVNHFRSLFQKNMLNEMGDTEDYRLNFNDFITQGEAILRAFELDRALENYEVVAVEIDLYEHICDNFYFKGFIDLVLKHKTTGRYLILDWKTSTAPWDVNKKMKDFIFACQMKFYKFFFCRKYNISIDDVDCAYVVLNRLNDKKIKSSYPGKIQKVPVTVNYEEIKEAATLLAKTMQKIHKQKLFLKVKFTGNEKFGCKFCPLKGNVHPLCDKDPEQYLKLLSKNESKEKNKIIQNSKEDQKKVNQ